MRAITPIGTRVLVTNGKYKGSVGEVVAHTHHEVLTWHEIEVDALPGDSRGRVRILLKPSEFRIPTEDSYSVKL